MTEKYVSVKPTVTGDGKTPGHTRFTPAEWKALRKAAAAEDRSVASYIERAVAAKLRHEGLLHDE